MREREKWQLVLLALYAEALHCGSFAEVTAGTMEIPKGEFGWTLYALQMRGLIAGCAFQPPRPNTPGNLMGVLRSHLALTPWGFQVAEGTLEQEDDDSVGRLHAIWEILRDAGCGIMANIVYRWIA